MCLLFKAQSNMSAPLSGVGSRRNTSATWRWLTGKGDFEYD